MNAGLGTLADLKSRLLPPSMQQHTTHDNALLSIGRGVAASFNRFCNRTFPRAEATTCVFSADRDHFFLPRFPVESVSKIEQRDDYASSWVSLALAGVLTEFKEETGLIGFWAPLGPAGSFIRVTYTGGFWVDDTEGGSGTLPTGATALPDDVREAWFLQCERVWGARDNLGQRLASKDAPAPIQELQPEVRRLLTGFIRYQMT